MKTPLASLLLLSVLSVTAQSTTPCEEQFKNFENHYTEVFNEKSFLTEQGRKQTLNAINDVVENCPSYSANIYVYGQEMLKKIIRPLNIGEEKTIWTNHLIALYDTQSQYFSQTKKENEIKKTLVAYDNKVINNQEALSAFDAAYKNGKEAFTPEALNLYTNLLLTDIHQNKNAAADPIKKADALNSSILAKINILKEELATANPNMVQQINNELNALQISSQNISTSLKSSKLDCQDWTSFYQADFEKNKTQTAWLANALMRLDQTNCLRDNEISNKMAKQYYELDKNSKSAFYLAHVALHNGQREAAITYFTESANLESNPTEKAKLYYRIADLHKRSDKALTQEFANQAIAINPEMFEAYIMLAQLYADADTSCFTNEFEEKAKYLLAAQTIEEIIKVNPKYEKSAKKISDGFMEKAPTKSEIRTAKMQGKTLRFGCWINQSLVVR